MSPIIDIQRRMVEVGRIRMGHKVEGRRPAKLEHWRLTSRDEQRMAAVAELYGGEVQPWEEQHEVYTTTDELPIMLLPGQTVSQWYELWSGGGCQRRCDGDRDHLTDQPCICDTETGERKCKPTTRLSVMLPDVPGLGTWRLESHGYYAAVELAGTAAMLEQATARGQFLPARLRIDQRSKVDGGKTTRYAVPVIDIDITVREALPGIGGAPAGQSFTPIAPRAGVTLTEGLDAVAQEVNPRTRTARSAAAIGPAPDDIVAGAPIPVNTEPPLDAGDDNIELEYLTERQMALLWATAGEVGEPRLREVVQEVTGQESTKLIPRSRFDQVLGLLRGHPPAGGEPAEYDDQLTEVERLTNRVLELAPHAEAHVVGALARRNEALQLQWLREQIARLEGAA